VYAHAFLLSPEQASITIMSKNNKKYKGESLNLTVMVAGNPLPSNITLQKMNMQTKFFMDYRVVTNTRTISFLDLSLGDSGQYRACVRNSPDALSCDSFNISITGNRNCHVKHYTCLKGN